MSDFNITGTQQNYINDTLNRLGEISRKVDLAAQTGTTPDIGEELLGLAKILGDATTSLLPQLELPKVGSNTGDVNFTRTMNGLDLNALMDMVGMEQRQTEVKTGLSTMKARAQERAEANEEKLKQVQENLEKMRSKGVLNGLMKALKIIGMIFAAIASVAMMAAGAVACAAGGAGAALIAVGAAMMFMVVDSAVQEGTGGKVGIGPGFVAGKIAEASGASDKVQGIVKMSVDMVASITMMAVSFGTSAAGTVGNVTSTVVDGLGKAANIIGKIGMVGNAVTTTLGGVAGVANAINDRDMSFIQATMKELQAIMERIAAANDISMEHIQEMLKRGEALMETVSDIVDQSNAAGKSLMVGPAMA